MAKDKYPLRVTINDVDKHLCPLCLDIVTYYNHVNWRKLDTHIECYQLRREHLRHTT